MQGNEQTLKILELQKEVKEKGEQNEEIMDFNEQMDEHEGGYEI